MKKQNNILQEGSVNNMQVRKTLVLSMQTLKKEVIKIEIAIVIPASIAEKRIDFSLKYGRRDIIILVCRMDTFPLAISFKTISERKDTTKLINTKVKYVILYICKELFYSFYPF